MTKQVKVVDAFKKGLRLEAIVPGVGRRPIADIVKRRDGVVFFDVGWSDSFLGQHPAHYLEGDPFGPPWSFKAAIGDVTIDVVEDNSPSDLALDVWEGSLPKPNPELKRALIKDVLP
jgi:hypothetical protein